MPTTRSKARAAPPPRPAPPCDKVSRDVFRQEGLLVETPDFHPPQHDARSTLRPRALFPVDPHEPVPVQPGETPCRGVLHVLSHREQCNPPATQGLEDAERPRSLGASVQGLPKAYHKFDEQRSKWRPLCPRMIMMEHNDPSFRPLSPEDTVDFVFVSEEQNNKIAMTSCSFSTESWPERAFMLTCFTLGRSIMLSLMLSGIRGLALFRQCKRNLVRASILTLRLQGECAWMVKWIRKKSWQL